MNYIESSTTRNDVKGIEAAFIDPTCLALTIELVVVVDDTFMYFIDVHP